MSLTSLNKLKPFSLAPPFLLILPLVPLHLIPTLTIVVVLIVGVVMVDLMVRVFSITLVPLFLHQSHFVLTLVPYANSTINLVILLPHFIILSTTRIWLLPHHPLQIILLFPLLHLHLLFGTQTLLPRIILLLMLLTSTWMVMFIRALTKFALVMAPIFSFNILVLLIFGSFNDKFILINLLHVSFISRNLLSVRQICSDNNVFSKFHSSLFFAKDACTSATLL